MSTPLRIIFLAAFICCPASFILVQGGALTPPGAPASTMKTLDQVEPRTPVNVTTVPGDASYHHITTTPGSYYLTGNLNVKQ